MYAQDSRELFVRVCFEPNCEAIIKRRAPVVLPTEDKVQEVLDEITAGIDPDEYGEPEPEPYVPNFVFPKDIPRVGSVDSTPLSWVLGRRKSS